MVQAPTVPGSMQAMRSVYKFLAYAIDVLIFVQAAMIAWAVFGLGKYIEDGNSISKASIEGDKMLFTEENGFMVHGINGELLIPLIGLILLIVSFFAKVPQGVKWAGMVFGAIVLQVALGLFAHGVPALGMLHGINALLLFWLAFRTAKQADAVVADTTPQAATVS
jgi:hypothetical protein